MIDRLRAGIGGVCLCCCAIGLAGCNPFAALAECDESGGREIAPGEVAEGVDVDARVAVAFHEYQGQLFWSETGDRSNVLIKTERGTEQAFTHTDCDGRFDSFIVPARATMVSEDGFVNGLGSFQIELATDGHISHFENAKVGARLDFEALKAAGYTPAAWISGFQPYLIVTLLAPEMKPQNAEVLADGDSIGSLTFP